MTDRYDPSSYWESRLERNSGLRGVGHISFGESYNEWLYRAKDRALARVVSTSDVAGKQVLDVGCGTGHFVDWYTSRNARVTGVDITRQSIDAQRRRHEGPFEVVDISAAGAPRQGLFDVVNAWDVLYHIVTDDAFERATSYLADSIKPGGLLILTDRLAAATDSRQAQHVKMRCASTYVRHFERRGIELIEVSFLFRWLNRYISLPVIDSRLAWMYYWLDGLESTPCTDNLSVGIWRRITSS